MIADKARPEDAALGERRGAALVRERDTSGGEPGARRSDARARVLRIHVGSDALGQPIVTVRRHQAQLERVRLEHDPQPTREGGLESMTHPAAAPCRIQELGTFPGIPINSRNS